LLAVRQARRAEEARHVAEEQRLEARHNLYASQMDLAQQAWEHGDLAHVQTLLDAWRPERGQEDPRGWEWRYLWRLCQGEALYTFPEHPDLVGSALFSPDGKLLATSGIDPTIRLWDVHTKRLVASLRGHDQWVNRIAFSPDGKLLASG